MCIFKRALERFDSFVKINRFSRLTKNNRYRNRIHHISSTMEKNEEDNNCTKSNSDRRNVSFKFMKSTSSKPLSINKLDETTCEPKDYLLSVDENELKSTIPKEKSQKLIIPLIKKNNWRTTESLKQKDSSKDSKLDELAVQELLKETAERNAEWENRDSSNTTFSIPLILQNKVPDGFETDDKLDPSLRPEESTLEDYDKIPVEQFGLAMLMGMGWQEGDAIGNNSKQCAKPIEVQLRPKGLGLGADASVLKKSQKKAKEEKLELVKGAFVNIVQGPHKGHYGQVMGLDEENARAIIKLSNKEKMESFPEFFFCLVSKKEFDKESRVINRESYENYKMKEERKNKESESHSKEEKKHKSLDSKSRREDRDSYKEESKKSKDHSAKHKRSIEQSEEGEYSRKAKKSKLWIRPQLRVRFIDDSYKKGKYFNKKLVVVDILSQNSCSCKTEDGRTLLEDISPSMLETVIPRDELAYVMIVQGKYRGELCTILKRDKSNCVATVQFLSDRNQALNIDYDSICEFVGDVAQFD